MKSLCPNFDYFLSQNIYKQNWNKEKKDQIQMSAIVKTK